MYNVFGITNACMDLEMLGESFALVEEQMKEGANTAQKILDSLLEESPSRDPDDRRAWSQFAYDDFDDRVQHRLPRIIYYPFLVSMYSLYESAVTEIAGIMQHRKGLETTLDPKKSDFLGEAKKYYRKHLNLKISPSNHSWERLRILAELRHAVVHANGHLDRVSAGKRRKIRKWIEQDIGIEDYYGEIIVSRTFVSTTFDIVRHDVGALIEMLKVSNSPQSSSDKGV